MFAIGNGVGDEAVDKLFQDVAHVVVDFGWNALDTASAGESAQRRLWDRQDGFFDLPLVAH